MKTNTVAYIAFKDIQEELNTENHTYYDEHGDIWNVSPSRLLSKKNKRLNKLLGVNKLNYGKK
jgi:hypothetical protein